MLSAVGCLLSLLSLLSADKRSAYSASAQKKADGLYNTMTITNSKNAILARRNPPYRSSSIAYTVEQILSAMTASNEIIGENVRYGQSRSSIPQMTRRDVRSLLIEALILAEDSSEVEVNDNEPSCE